MRDLSARNLLRNLLALAWMVSAALARFRVGYAKESRRSGDRYILERSRLAGCRSFASGAHFRVGYARGSRRSGDRYILERSRLAGC
jgi:hypothetical protein